MISEKIDIFLDVGQELNFSTVAKKRYTTQPTISRQIGDLESEWGIQEIYRERSLEEVSAYRCGLTEQDVFTKHFSATQLKGFCAMVELLNHM